MIDQETGASNRFRYQSDWINLVDSDGELVLSPARLYHSGEGRFLQRDPAGYVDGLNLYTAFGGDAVTFIDPKGRFNMPHLDNPGAPFIGPIWPLPSKPKPQPELVPEQPNNFEVLKFQGKGDIISLLFELEKLVEEKKLQTECQAQKKNQ